jgi:putative phosphotransacetylase
MADAALPLEVPVAATARHVRLKRAHIDALFGKDHQLRPLCELSQPREFAALETVAVRGGDGRLEDVRVVGPEVKQTRVELSLRDHEVIDGGAELKLSRHLDASGSCTLEGPAGTVVLAEGLLNALRTLRISGEEAARHGLGDDQRVTVRVEGERARVLQDIVVSVEEGVVTELVLDADEAGAVELGPHTRATVLADDS